MRLAGEFRATRDLSFCAPASTEHAHGSSSGPLPRSPGAGDVKGDDSVAQLGPRDHVMLISDVQVEHVVMLPPATRFVPQRRNDAARGGDIDLKYPGA